MSSPDSAQTFGLITQKALSLFAKYPEELRQGKVPQTLSLPQILQWEHAVSDARQSRLSQRLHWIALSGTARPSEDKWQHSFKKVWSIYSAGYKARPSAEGLQQIAFSQLLAPWLEVASSQLQLSKIFSIQSQRAWKGLLMQALSKYAAQSLMEDFHHFRQQGHGYSAYVEQIWEEGYRRLWLKYAALARVLSELTDRFVLGLKLMDDRLQRDSEALLTTFGLSLNEDKVVNLQLGLTAQHAADGQVCILHFNSGKKVVYKPRSVALDRALDGLLSYVNNYEGIRSLRSAATVGNEAYFWQEYIQETACDDLEQLRHYYQRIGQFGALLYALGSTDYHYGNHIAYGEYPILTDNETLFSAGLRTKRGILGDPQLDERAKDSLIQGHFLLDAGRVIYPRSKSIIGAYTKGDAIPSIEVIHANQDHMRCVETLLEIRGQNHPVYRGEMVDPLDYQKEIEKGFDRMLAALCGDLEGFQSAVERFTGSYSATFRLLLRPSAWYNQLLQGALRPENCQSGIDRSIYFERTAAFYLSMDTEEARDYCEKEIAQCEQMLSPWFHLSLNEPAEGTSDSGLIQRSARQVVQDRSIEIEMHQDWLRKQLSFVQSTVSDQDEICGRLLRAYTLFHSKQEGLSNATLIAQLGLGQGSLGLCVLFAAAWRVNGDRQYLRFIEAELGRLQDLKPAEANVNCGAVEGLGSLFVALRMLAEMGIKLQDHIDWSQLLAFAEKAAEACEEFSFGKGLSGLSYGLNGLLEFLPELKADALAKQLFDKLVDAHEEGATQALGLYDGLAGVVLAMDQAKRRMRLSSATCETIFDEFVDACRNHPSEGVDLSNGLGGVLMVLKRLQRDDLSPFIQQEKERLYQLVIQRPPNDTYATGMAGIIGLFKDNAAWEPFKARWMEYYSKNGRFNLGQAYLDTSFANGVSGVVYHRMKWLDDLDLPAAL